MAERKEFIVGVTGASALPVGLRFIEVLSAEPNYHVHVIFSTSARMVMKYELGMDDENIAELTEPDNITLYDEHNMAASISSGSFVTKTEGMIVAPCSVKTLMHIAHGSDETLIARAAFNCIKERRPLVLVTRETPETSAYLDNKKLALAQGAIIFPPLLTWYHVRGKKSHEITVQDMTDFTVGRVLDQFRIESNLINRWETPKEIKD